MTAYSLTILDFYRIRDTFSMVLLNQLEKTFNELVYLMSIAFILKFVKQI